MVELKKQMLVSECSRKIRVTICCPSLPGTFSILEQILKLYSENLSVLCKTGRLITEDRMLPMEHWIVIELVVTILLC